MKVQIRQGVFETNSSSTHAIAICSKEEYEGLQIGTHWITSIYYTDCILPKEKAIQENIELYKEKYSLKDVPVNWEEWFESKIEDGNEYDIEDFYKPFELYTRCDGCYDWFNEHHTTKSGDEIVAFGYYGYS